MQTFLYKPFQKKLDRLARAGGVAQLAYDEVRAAINNWRHRLTVTITPTRNGESRIPHAVKYDLRGAYRLVTVEHENARILLFVGSHADTDLWLDRHRGARFVVSKDGSIEFTPIATVEPDVVVIQDTPADAPRLTGPVFRQLSADVLELLGLSKGISLTLGLITYEGLADDESMWEIIHAQPYSSNEQRNATIHAIDHLRHGRLKQAIACIESFADQATAAPDAVVEALVAGTASDTLANLSQLSDEDFEQRFRDSGYTEWLLFLHPDQQKHVDASHNGPARLLGVSGSGKTCVLVHRANALAKRYPEERILVLVLNESLRQLLTRLLTKLCPEEQRRRIDVMRIYDYCYKAVKTINPDAVINPIDEVSGEDLAICWSEFTNRPHAKRESKPVRDAIQAMLVEPWGYLQDELVWIRTGIGGSQPERKEYFTVERRGRSLPFPLIQDASINYDSTRTTTGFQADTRARVLRLLDDYEEYMKVGGLLDEDGVALMAHELREKIAQHAALRYRCVLVDEVQDCSTTQLSVIAKIPTEESDGLLLVGDPVQKVFPRQQHLKSAGIDIVGRATRLNTNYRNTREILNAAYTIIEAYRDRSPIPEEEILRPEMACRNGPRPTLVECETPEEQWRCVAFLIRHLRDTDRGSICVASPQPSIRINPRRRRGAQPLSAPKVDIRLLDICHREKWPVTGIEGHVSLDRLAESVAGARFEDMKGFEFRNVILVDLEDARLVPRSIPRDEHWRVAFQVYVAMTRAQESLWMFSVGQPSPLLKHLDDLVDRMTGRTLLGLPPREEAKPASIADEDEQDEDEQDEDEQDEDEQDEDEQDEDEQDEDGQDEDDLLPFDPSRTSTLEILAIATRHKGNPDVFDRIMVQLSRRDCSRFSQQFQELRAHWRMLVARMTDSVEPEWPEHAVARRSDALSGKMFPYEKGMLSFMGYQVGMTSFLTPIQRREILAYVYLGKLPRVTSAAYTNQWGEPRTPTRLAKLKRTLRGFIRNAQRRGGNMGIAIQEWQDDLNFIEERFEED
jgi:hypothetical protein